MHYLLALNTETNKHYIKSEHENFSDILNIKKAGDKIINSDGFHFDQSIETILAFYDHNILVDQDYVNCKNNLTKVINKLTPLIHDYFTNNDWQLTNNSDLYKKNKEEVNKIIEKFTSDDLRVYLDITQYSIKLEYKSWYKSKDNGYSSIGYIHDYSHIYNLMNDKDDYNHETRKRITLNGYKKAKKDIKLTEEKISDLKSKLSSIKWKYDL